MRFLAVSLAAVALSTGLTGCGGANDASVDVSNLEEAWDANNDPRRLAGTYEVEFAALPTDGRLTSEPWTDSYWPSYKGGLANRWASLNSVDPFAYSPPSEAAVRRMSQSQLRQLSPAEKYDIFRGQFTFPLLQYERRRTSAANPTWYGICHGWAQASLHFPKEPKPLTLRSAGGIDVPFGSADVKGLLALAQQYNRPQGATRLLGRRCSLNPSDDSPACRDVNAGSFHIILTNFIGRLGQGFVFDFERALEVWNFPVFGYASEILGETDQVYASAAPGTQRIVRVKSVVNYISGHGPSWDPVPYSISAPQNSQKTYLYNLELDADGKIIGGEWLQGQRPDFLWTQTPTNFDGTFSQVQEIYEASVQ